MHRRENYCLNDFIGDLGGVFEVLVYIMGIVMVPLSRHAFVVEMLEKNFRIYQRVNSEKAEDAFAS